MYFYILGVMREIQFNKYKTQGFFVSAALILLSFVFIFTKGFNLSIDFTGGIIIEFTQKGEEISANQTREALKELSVQDYTVQKTEDGITLIKIGTKVQGEDYAPLVQRVKERLGLKFTKTDIEFIKIDFVSPQIGKELAFKAFLAVLFSLLAVLLYISIRFELRYSLGAIFALVHDVTLTIGFISLFSLPVDVSTIAAILTVVGYSINDSVVIFDRIRENFKLNKTQTNAHVIQASLNATLSRTIITSLTTLIAILAIILIGGSILRPFATIIFFGIFVGTLSSIFIAPCLLYNRKTEDAKLSKKA